MTLKGHAQLTKADHRRIARLLQLHFETHPSRIGKLWGVSASGVRKVWRELAVEEMGPLTETLQELGKLSRSRANGA